MKTTLGTFEGRMVQAAALKVSGGSGEKIGTLDQDEEVFLIVKGHVAEITHGYIKSTYTRLHKVAATNVVLLDRAEGARFLEEAIQLQDERFGLQQLFSQTERALGGRIDPATGEIVDVTKDPRQQQLGTAIMEHPSSQEESTNDLVFDGTEPSDELTFDADELDEFDGEDD